MVKNYAKLSVAAHKKTRGKLSVESTMKVRNKDELSLAYTPGVAGPCLEIAKDPAQARILTSSKNTVAIVSDGSAVLGLGDIGPEAALPVMEGKAVLLKRFAAINGFPIVLSTRSVDDIVDAVKAIAPTFGAINLEDISAPRCFEIEERLCRELSIPVMHDDQHGTAIVVYAALINALALTNKKLSDVRIVISGVGAAGVAITRFLRSAGATHLILVDSKGILSPMRTDVRGIKSELAEMTNPDAVAGTIADALQGADVFIGVSKGDIVTKAMVETMAEGAIVFALANPDPEIHPTDAEKAGAYIIATGRSDFPNQVNNALAFPGIYKGLITSGARTLTTEMKLAAAQALAKAVKKPTPEKIVPAIFEKGVADAVARAVIRTAKKQ